MHSYLKWAIYIAIIAFSAILVAFFYMNINHDRKAANDDSKRKINIAQDSMMKKVTDTKAYYIDKIDSIVKVERRKK